MGRAVSFGRASAYSGTPGRYTEQAASIRRRPRRPVERAPSPRAHPPRAPARLESDWSADSAGGMDGAMKKLMELPAGPVLLGAVAVSLTAPFHCHRVW
ncbi:DUF1206 domain-containing protein [Helcobacillus massiliensis]|uniref:DUF1206 domain-containing protein n=1 Tax=Helcobacillus massiliensis TaxID=521392 RepID=UPI0032B7062D